MKNFALILCLLLSPLSYASYHEGTGGDSSNGNSSGGGGGYGSGGSGGAAALLAVGALVYFMNRDTEEEETESTFVRRKKVILEFHWVQKINMISIKITSMISQVKLIYLLITFN